jgi:cytochrome P450
LGIAEVEGFDPFWVATKHADILEISRNNARFPSAVRATTLTSKAGDARARAITGTPHLVRSSCRWMSPIT